MVDMFIIQSYSWSTFNHVLLQVYFLNNVSDKVKDYHIMLSYSVGQ